MNTTIKEAISSRMYLLLALPHLWLTVLKLFHTKVHFIKFDQNMVYSRFFSCTSTKPVPQSFMSQGDHLNMCCFPNFCFYALFCPLSCNNFNESTK